MYIYKYSKLKCQKKLIKKNQNFSPKFTNHYIYRYTYTILQRKHIIAFRRKNNSFLIFMFKNFKPFCALKLI